MKTIPFIKMEGAGNDFVVIDRVDTDLKKLAVKICDRKTGIGADGLLICERSKKADYKMRIINADGSEAEMCGNGSRCMAAYINRTKKPLKKKITLETLAGIIQTEILSKGRVKVRLSDPKDYRPGLSVSVNGRVMRVNFINTGVPHAVIFVNGLENINVFEIGRLIRRHDAFAPRGANANFVEQLKANLIKIRTYERGVEDETKACGTGSVAAAIVTYLKSNPEVRSAEKISMNVLVASGEVLTISFRMDNRKISDVWLTGSTNFISKGDCYV